MNSSWYSRAKEKAWLLRHRPRKKLISKVVNYKRNLEGSASYVERPAVSVIVQSFNQVGNIKSLERRLRKTRMNELIVCEDGSIDGSFEEWHRLLNGRNDFLIRSNDLHEIRTYNRAIAYSQGRYICLMQDDDEPSEDGLWLDHAISAFEAFPSLAVLGGWMGFMNYFDDEYNSPWHGAERQIIPFRDPRSNRPFMFVENVNIGPYFLRRDVFSALGGFDTTFSQPGDPGICFESEFCYRVWKGGYQVGLMNLPVKAPMSSDGYIMPGGTLLWAKEKRMLNDVENKKKISQIYDSELSLIQRLVTDANSRLLPATGTLA